MAPTIYLGVREYTSKDLRLRGRITVRDLVLASIVSLIWLTTTRFWDWSLDWEDLPGSLIFDSELGFGGDGDPKTPKYKHNHCVTDLPFKGLKPQWSGSAYDPHCLTRSFNDDGWVGHFVNPESLAEVLSKETYEEFFFALEMRAHDIIPTGVRGDFMAFTAPNGKHRIAPMGVAT